MCPGGPGAGCGRTVYRASTIRVRRRRTASSTFSHATGPAGRPASRRGQVRGNEAPGNDHERRGRLRFVGVAQANAEHLPPPSETSCPRTSHASRNRNHSNPVLNTKVSPSWRRGDVSGRFGPFRWPYGRHAVL